MPLGWYTQIRLPLVSFGGITYAFRINRNDYSYDVTAPYTFTCDHFKWLLPDGLELGRELNDEDGDMPSDELELTMQDRLAITGVVNGYPVSLDFGEEQTSFIDWIFTDESATYTLFVSRYVDGTNENDELFFIGDLDPLTIPREHTGTIHPHTEDAERLQNATLRWTMCAQRLKKLTVGDLVTSLTHGFTQSDMSNSSQRKAFYGGTVYRPPFHLGKYPQSVRDEEGYGNEDFKSIYPDDYRRFLQKASYGCALSGAWPRGIWGISLNKVCEKIADIAEIDYDTSSGSTCMFAGYDANYAESGGNASYTGERMAPIDDTFFYTQICYNLAFGISPIDGSVFESPISYNQDTPLSQILKDIALLFGCYISISINQSEKRAKLLLVSRTADTGNLPSNFILSSSSEAERQIGKQRVTLKFRADDSEVSCPSRSGDSIDIEIPWRWRPWGNSTGITNQYHFFNKKKSGDKQYIHWTLTNQPKTKLETEGWLGGAFLYRYHSGTSNLYYPTGAGLGADGVTNTDWSGFYALTHWIYDGDTLAAEAQTHPLESLARFYANELLGNRMVLEREYIGITDDAGNIGGVVPLLRTSEFFRGSVREFKAVKVKQNLGTGVTSLTSVEVLDSAVWQNLPVFLDGESGGSTGGTSTSVGSHESESLVGGNLLQQPLLSFDNTAQPQEDDIIGLTLKNHATQSANIFEHQESNGTVLSYLREDGTAHYPTITQSVAAKTTTYTITNADSLVTCNGTFTVTTPSAPRSGQTFELKNIGSGTITLQRAGSQTLDGTTSLTLAAGEAGSWCYDNAVWRRIATTAEVDLSNVVVTDPSSGNVIISQTNSNNALTVQAHASPLTTQRTLRINNTDGSEMTYWDRFGRGTTKATYTIALSTDSTALQITMASGGGQNPLQISNSSAAFIAYFTGTGWLHCQGVSSGPISGAAGAKFYAVTGSGDTDGFLLEANTNPSTAAFRYENSSGVDKFIVDPKGGVFWQAQLRGPVATVTGNTTLDDSHHYVRVNASAATTIALPAAAGCTGREYIIKRVNTNANNVTVDPNGAETIDGVANVPLVANQSITIKSNGANWDRI